MLIGDLSWPVMGLGLIDLADPKWPRSSGITLPAGFGSDFAGVVDEVGAEATGFATGDRVYGAAIGRSVADFVLVKTPAATLWPTPEGIRDEVAATLPVSGLTASAALAAIGLRAGDTVLIGGAAGGVGVFAVQLAKRAGARVLGTASEPTFGFLRGLGAEPVGFEGSRTRSQCHPAHGDPEIGPARSRTAGGCSSGQPSYGQMQSGGRSRTGGPLVWGTATTLRRSSSNRRASSWSMAADTFAYARRRLGQRARTGRENWPCKDHHVYSRFTGPATGRFTARPLPAAAAAADAAGLRRPCPGSGRS
ncbi:alcohol dehydrogenase catalytic domain-containing protein [Streptomyces sp. NPDC008001]|uniref:alcohol dehydrogenase catalytic domain-containing protein n=1 Tax=Streptomyces sp. NPDC008001 TaxID=3364804 RepID=UPI0036E3DB26